jgi:hypothetical protein
MRCVLLAVLANCAKHASKGDEQKCVFVVNDKTHLCEPEKCHYLFCETSGMSCKRTICQYVAGAEQGGIPPSTDKKSKPMGAPQPNMSDEVENKGVSCMPFLNVCVHFFSGVLWMRVFLMLLLGGFFLLL